MSNEVYVMSFKPVIVLAALISGASYGATPAELLQRWQTSSNQAFSAARGDAFFHAQQGEWSCAPCHTANPRNTGKHKITGKVIEPLAPAGNAKRFTNPAHVEKWFKRNCKDVVGRECTSTEKGDVLTYLLSLK
jgi:hypothetical protein